MCDALDSRRLGAEFRSTGALGCVAGASLLTGNLFVSLTAKDLAKSRAFDETLGFQATIGDGTVAQAEARHPALNRLPSGDDPLWHPHWTTLRHLQQVPW